MIRRSRRYASLYALIGMLTISASFALLTWVIADSGGFGGPPRSNAEWGAGEFGIALIAMVALFCLYHLFLGESAGLAGQPRVTDAQK